MDILSFNIVEAIFDDDPSTSTVVKIALFMALFWGIFFALGSKVISYLVQGKEWLRRASDREYASANKDDWKKYGLDFASSDEYFERFERTWPWMQLVTFQHLVGGFLCLPSALEMLNESTRSSLACLGILSEVGWEISDIVKLTYKRYFVPGGEAMVVSKK